jgi:hypothetical protein
MSAPDPFRRLEDYSAPHPGDRHDWVTLVMRLAAEERDANPRLALEDLTRRIAARLVPHGEQAPPCLVRRVRALIS